MDCAGTGSGYAYAGLAGELRMRARHERGHLFMANLNEVHLAVGAFERAHDAVDAVAGITVNAAHAPLVEAADEKVARGFSHGKQSSSVGHFRIGASRVSWAAARSGHRTR